MIRRCRDERGTVAVVFAVSCTMLFGVAAMGVDLGNAYARKRDIQTQADLAVLAAGAYLPNTPTNQDDILAALQQYAASNLIAGQDDATTWNFINENTTDGHLEFLSPHKIRLTAPHATVDFGLAAAIGFTSVDVSNDAAAEIRTPSAALPFFVPDTCTWGNVAIGDPPPGHDSDTEGPCGGANEGNFGTVILPRDDESGRDAVAARNIMEGAQHALGAFIDYSGPEHDCEGEPGAVTAPSWPDPDGDRVNCLETDTGNVKSLATEGFVTGRGGDPGRLDAAENPTAAGCDPHQGSGTATVAGIQINDEVLTCYISDPSVTVGDVGREPLPPGAEHVISPEIFESPRFFWLPVISADPESGGSNTYAIVGFRGAFLTGQPAEASPTDPLSAETVAAGNGLQVRSNHVEGVNVALINPDALPETAAPSGSTIPYLGVGTRVVRLIE